jgi:hypothetical protein
MFDAHIGAMPDGYCALRGLTIKKTIATPTLSSAYGARKYIALQDVPESQVEGGLSCYKHSVKHSQISLCV